MSSIRRASAGLSPPAAQRLIFTCFEIRCRKRREAGIGRLALTATRWVETAAVILGAATLLAMLSAAQAALWLHHEGDPVPWIGLMRASVVDWYSTAIFVPLLYWCVRRWPICRGSWKKALPIHAGASLALALLKETIFVSVGSVFRPGMFNLPEILAGDYFEEVAAFGALIALLHAVFFQSGPTFHQPERASRAREEESEPTPFVVRDRSAVRWIAPDEVQWVEAQGNYARLNTPRGAHLVRETMVALERRLSPHFVRVHRRAMVNWKYVDRLEPKSHGEYAIILTSGVTIVTGRSYAAGLRLRLEPPPRSFVTA